LTFGKKGIFISKGKLRALVGLFIFSVKRRIYIKLF